ncbi:MAG: hypothetical protein GY804_09285 [Alphaproteobacteria bacterium]|nr:hypothetical protein [Alphaproteobacteria bacterium]
MENDSMSDAFNEAKEKKTGGIPGVGKGGYNSRKDYNPDRKKETPGEHVVTAMALASIESMFENETALSPEGKAFKESLLKRLDEKKHMKESKDVNIPGIGEVTFIFGEKNNTLALVFKNDVNRSLTPLTSNSDIISTKAAAANPSARLFQIIIINEDDYKHSDIIFNYIANAIIATSETIDLTISTFAPSKDDFGYMLILEANVNDVRKEATLRYPGEVLPRIDYGVVIKYSPNRGNDRYDQKQIETLGVLGGYTHICMKDEHGIANNIVPIPVMSYMSSRFPIPGILGLFVWAATKVFIGENLWMAPFTRLLEGQEGLDIGKLDLDRMEPIKTFTEFQHMIANRFTEPELAISVEIGRPQLPGLTDLVFAPDEIAQDIVDFIYGKDQVKNDLDVTSMIMPYTGGTVSLAEGPVDMTNADFLNLSDGTRDEKIEGLLFSYEDPSVKMKLLKDIMGEDAVEAIYMGFLCIVNPEFFSMTYKDISKAITAVSSGNAGNTRRSLNNLGRGEYTLTNNESQATFSGNPFSRARRVYV